MLTFQNLKEALNNNRYSQNTCNTELAPVVWTVPRGF